MQRGAGAAAVAARSTSADEMVEELVHRPMSPAVRIVFTLLTLLTLTLVLNQQFNLHLFGITLIDNRYLFLMAGATLPLVFLAYPWRQPKDKTAVGRLNPDRKSTRLNSSH